jgi:hypothetical protein
MQNQLRLRKKRIPSSNTGRCKGCTVEPILKVVDILFGTQLSRYITSCDQGHFAFITAAIRITASRDIMSFSMVQSHTWTSPAEMPTELVWCLADTELNAATNVDYCVTFEPL